MIAAEVIEEVQRMLVTGKHSCREISRRTRVSRSTIERIAKGERLAHCPTGDFAGTQIERSTVAERCPDCGGMVYLPCLPCDAKLFRERRQVMRRVDSSRSKRDPRRPPVPSRRGSHRSP